MVGAQDNGLDSQNQRLSDNLSQKVSRLKSLAFDIENETKAHVRLLDGMDDEFDGSTSLLQGSFQRVQKMVSSGRGSRRLICYMTAFMVIFFMITYYLISHSSTK